MRVASEVREHGLHDREDEALVRVDELAKERLIFGKRPEIAGFLAVCAARNDTEVERAAAEDPSFDEIGMLQARLVDREVALVDRAEALGAEAHLVIEREAAKHLQDFHLRFVVQRGIDAVAVEDGEADLAQRVAELAREGGRAHVARADRERVVERFLRRLGEVIGLPFLDAFVTDVVLVGGHEG